LRCLVDQHVVALLPQGASFGPDGDHVALHRKLHVVGTDPWQIQVAKNWSPRR